VDLGDVADDREPETRSGQAARGVCAIEAVEDACRVVGVDAGAAVGDGDRALADVQLDRLDAVPVELGGVLQQVAHRAFQTLAVAADDGAVGVHVNLPAGAPLHAFGTAPAQRGQVDRLLGPVAAPGQGELDELVHQVVELAGLALEVVEQALAGVGGELGGAAQDAGVHAQARQRGAQLVRGVLHQPVLGIASGGEPTEHGVERRRQPADLVVPLDRNRAIDAPVHADVLRDCGQPHEAPGDAPRQQPARARRGQQDGQADPGDLPGQPAEHAPALVDVDRHLQRAAGAAERGGELAVAVIADGHLGRDGPPGNGRGGEGPREVRHGERHGSTAERGDGAVGGHRPRDQLLVVVAPAAATRVSSGAGPEHDGRCQHLLLAVGQRGGHLAQRAIDLRGDAVRGGTVAQHAHQPRDDRADEGEGQREPRTQTHGCRTA
jgi:hypothetical protein